MIEPQQHLPHLKAVRMNNAGAGLLALGRYEEAISHLVNASLAVRECFEGNDGSSCHNEDPDGYSRDCVLDRIILESQGSASRPNPGGGACKDAEYYVHDRPIRLPDHLSPGSFRASSAAVLFNLALAYHLASMDPISSRHLTPTQREAMAQRALKLYQAVFRHHYLDRGGSRHHTTEPGEVSNLLLLSLINNSGQAYHMLRMCDDSSKCFRFLFVLLWLRKGSAWGATRTPEQEQMFAGYLKTASAWLQKSSLHEAAAAAA